MEDYMDIKEGYIVCSESFKREFLREEALKKEFKNYKFLNMSTLKSQIMGSVSDEGILYLSKNPKVNSCYNAREYVKYLPYVENKDYQNDKLNFLRDLKLDLIDKGYYTYDSLLIDMIKKSSITFVNIKKTKELLRILSVIGLDGVDFKYTKNEKKDLGYYEFNTIEEELDYVVKSIKDLVNNGVKYENIKICNANESYSFLLNRFKYTSNLPISLKSETNYLTKYSAKLFIEYLDKYDNFKDLFKELENHISQTDYIEYLNIVNSYHGIKYKPCELKEAIRLKLEGLKFNADRYSSEIGLIDQSELSNFKDDYIFFVNFDLNVPVVVKDNGYLSDNEFELLNIDTTKDRCRYNHDNLVNSLYSVSNLVLTVSYQHAFESTSVSPLVEELNIKKLKYKETEDLFGIDLVTDSLNLARDLDAYTKYGENSDLLSKAFEIKYDSYDNQFSGLSKESIDAILSRRYGLSYTAMDIFYSCKFRFFCEKILKLNKFEDTIQISLGNIAHKLFEESYNENFNFDETLNEAINEMINKDTRENKELTEKERFYIDRMCLVVKEAIESNRMHEDKSKLKSVLTENNFNIDIDDNVYFTGKVDKILYDEDLKKFVVIDYKTGNKSDLIDNLEDGMNQQLPSYIYLISKSDSKLKGYQPIGMYIEPIHINKNNNMDDFKLHGYTSNLSEDSDLIDIEYTNIKMNKDGTPNKNSFKYLLNYEEFNKARDILENNINKFVESYKNGDYEIKYTELKNVTPCSYCKMRDICFKEASNKNKLEYKPFKKEDTKKEEDED